MAKDYLKSRGIGYEYITIVENREDGQAVAMKTGWNAIPIITIGDESLLGFERAKLDQALRAHKVMK
jgi:hypothetical protein